MATPIEDQKRTYVGVMRLVKISSVLIILLMVILAATLL
ncbi:MAG: aa3-type cytochrome c oxidase subunit IV [Pseudomonadota bacterium]